MAHLRFTSRVGILVAGPVLALSALAPGSALADAGGSNLPLEGSLSGTSVHSYVTGHLDAMSTGQVTHLGLATLAQGAQIVINPGPPVSLSLAGTWTLTAANGDELWGTSVGTGTPTDATHITLVIDYISTGGTGRFASASVTFTATVYHHQCDFVDNVSYGEHEATLDGYLSW